MSILDRLRDGAVEITALKLVVAGLRREADERPQSAVEYTALRVAATAALDAYEIGDTEEFGECMADLLRALE